MNQVFVLLKSEFLYMGVKKGYNTNEVISWKS